MQLFLYMLAAILVGMMVAAQPPMNAIMARALGGAYAATTVAIFIAFTLATILYLVAGTGEISPRTLSQAPWWVYLSAVAGVAFVASGVMVAPVTGALAFFVCIIAGQLLGAMLADHFGAFGLQVREISVPRVLGLVLVLVGAVLVSRY
jgi:transporter family-2 protein